MVRSHDDVTVPLWREPAFRNTLWLAGAAVLAAALAGPAAPAAAGTAAPLGGLVLPGLLGAAYVGAAGAGWFSRLREAALFGLVAGVLPLLIGEALRSTGLVPAPSWLGWLAASGALLSMPAVACLEGAPAPGREGPGPATGRAPLLAAALFTLALAAALQTEPPGAALGFAVTGGAFVSTAAWIGGAALAQLRYRSFQAPRAAAAALLLCGGGGMAAAGLAWF